MAEPRRTGIALGALLVVGMRWTDRLLGLVSTLILARLLVPEDFGIVAMASLVVGIIDVVLDLGVNVALIHEKDPTREVYDTAWTLRLVQSLLSAVLILAAVPWGVGYFDEPRLAAVLQVTAASVAIAGLENIGVVDFQKRMAFGRDFRFFFVKRAAGFVVTVALAWWLRSYWAMVIGALTGRMVGVLASYLMHEYRPRPSLARARRLWSFAQWVLARNVGVYAATRIDKFVVGRRADTGAMGAYSLADEIAAMPTTELLAPLGRLLFPAFVEARDGGRDLARAFALALGVQTLVAIPAGTGLAMVAADAIPLLLGAGWEMAIPLVEILALVNVIGALTHSSIYLMLARGQVRALALAAWVDPVLFVALIVSPAAPVDIFGIAQARLLAVGASALYFFVIAARHTREVRLATLVAQVWRPALASAGMAAALAAWPPTALPPVVLLTAKVGAGAMLYAAFILLLWRLARTPDGAERYCMQKIGILARVERLLHAPQR